MHFALPHATTRTRIYFLGFCVTLAHTHIHHNVTSLNSFAFTRVISRRPWGGRRARVRVLYTGTGCRETMLIIDIRRVPRAWDFIMHKLISRARTGGDDKARAKRSIFACKSCRARTGSGFSSCCKWGLSWWVVQSAGRWYTAVRMYATNESEIIGLRGAGECSRYFAVVGCPPLVVKIERLFGL